MDAMSLHGAVTSTSINNLSMLEGLVGRWAGDKTLTQTLITGLSGVITADMTTELHALAAQLTALGLDGVVRENPPDAALEHLRARPDAAPFLQQFERFLVRHGHRCVTEAEWRHPRWREAPGQVIETLAAYVATPNRATTAAEAEQRRQREAATAELERRLDPMRRRIFQGLLGRVQHLVRMRDNGQYYLVKLALPMRRLFVTLAGRWVACGLLDREDDFFFLGVPEVEAVLAILAHGDAAAAGVDLRSVVASRRLAFAHWFTVAAPEVLDRQGRPVAAAAAPVADADGASVLRGVAASRGRVIGVARVVSDPRAAHRLRPGEILVTRATDPGWTPVFSVIGGLVLEVGGTLSHGAIVAREYGLPAVVNVPDATRRIRDGQTVTVDGSEGIVKIT
jgi:pyruvate,water dikinase